MSKRFKIEVEKNALFDIQNGIDYYDEQLPGLGKKFENIINKNFNTISKIHFIRSTSKTYGLSLLRNILM